MKINELILGSTSVYRAQLLKQAGITCFRQLASGADESHISRSSPAQMAEDRAEHKALGVDAPAGSLVIGADQVVEFEGQSFGKAKTRPMAKERLELLNGRSHYLHSAFALIYQKGNGYDPVLLHRQTVTVTMTMDKLSPLAIEAYLDTNEWQGCAGCYQFENKGVHLFKSVLGDSSAIIGLPMPQLLSTFRRLGIDFLVKNEGPWDINQGSDPI